MTRRLAGFHNWILLRRYPEITPYQYASNDPILNIDLDGLEGAVSNISKIAETAVTTSGSLLAEVKIFAVLPKVAKAGTSILSKAATAMNAVGKGISWFAKGLWNEGVVPTVDWVNHNVNPVYSVFNGINSQFTHQDYFNGTPMTHAEGITDAALPFIPFGKIGGVVEKTVFKTVEKVAAKEGGQLLLKPGAANLTQEGLEHILDRHWLASQAKSAGKFLDGTTARGLKDMISTATTKGVFRPNTMGRAGTIAEYNFGRVIGTTSRGASAFSLRVVIGTNGNVITAFPY